MNLFLDTNVLVDVLAHREGLYGASAAVWSRATTAGTTGWISAISLNNAFYLTRRAGGWDGAAKAVKVLRDAFQIVPLDVTVIDAAIDTGVRDFEDAIQFVSAERVAANYLVTRNVAEFPKTGIAVVKPEEVLALLGAADAP